MRKQENGKIIRKRGKINLGSEGGGGY